MAGAVEAGKGFVRIFTDLSPMEKGLKQIEAKMKSFGSGLSTVGGGIAGIGLAATAIGTTALGGITALATRFAGLGDVLSKAHDRTGIAASSLSELGYAAEQSGTDLGTVEKSVSKMQKSISGAVGGSKSMAAAFASIGLNAKALSTLSPEQQFLTVGKAIAGIQDPTMRAAKAMEIFGKSGTQLLPLLTSDIAALRQEARDLGVVISDEDAANATNLGDAFDRVKKATGGIGTQIGAAMAKPLTLIANTVAGIIGKVSKWVAANRGIVQTVAMVAAGFVVVGTILTGLGIAIVGVGATIAAIGTIIGSVVTVATAAFSAIAAAVGFILSPVGLVVAAIAGIGAYFVYAAVTSTGAIGKLSEMFGTLAGTATEAWGGIVAALSTGDLQTAGEIAFTALEIGWLVVTSKIQEVWANVTDFLRNIWLNAVESIVQIGASIYFGIAKYFDLISTSLVGAFDAAGVGIYGVVDTIATYIYGAFDSAITNVIAAFDKLGNVLAILNVKTKEFFGAYSAEQSQQMQTKINDTYLQRTGQRNADLNARRDQRSTGLTTRANDRQFNLDSRAGARQTGIDQRDQQRQATAQQFGSIVSEDFNRRKSVSSVDKSGLAAAQARMAELQGALASKAAEAQAKAAEAAGSKGAETSQQAAMSVASSDSGGSTGSFIGGIAAAIQGGGTTALEDLNAQQLDVLGSIDGRLREIKEDGGLE